MLFGIGLILTGSTSQAMNLGRNSAGAASAVIGGVGYIVGGLVSPIVSYGNITIAPFALCAAFLLTSAAIIRRQVQTRVNSDGCRCNKTAKSMIELYGLADRRGATGC